jgi:hypothetical protein
MQGHTESKLRLWREYEYQCQCNPGEGFSDRQLAGGFCLKMWYFNGKVDLESIVDGRPLDVYAVVQSMEISSTQNLRDLIDKSRSRMFSREQYVVVQFAGTIVAEEQAFYEVSDIHTYFHTYIPTYIHIRSLRELPYVRE